MREFLDRVDDAYDETPVVVRSNCGPDIIPVGLVRGWCSPSAILRSHCPVPSGGKESRQVVYASGSGSGKKFNVNKSCILIIFESNMFFILCFASYRHFRAQSQPPFHLAQVQTADLPSRMVPGFCGRRSTPRSCGISSDEQLACIKHGSSHGQKAVCNVT
jgi:hypothetical protein